MKPVIAIIGRPNVGKSTLFNRFTASRNALVDNQPGVTRDYQFGDMHLAGRAALIVDTGGLDAGADALSARVSELALQVAADADLIVLLVDGQQDCTPDDEAAAGQLRRLGKPIYLAVNKVEGREPELAMADFYRLGLGEVFAISALRGDGIVALKEALRDALPASLPEPPATDNDTPRVAIIGRPNVGKSTLINRIVSEERVIASETPGTTRDSIAVPFARHGKRYLLIDTAGVRRKARVQGRIEKFSVVKTLQAIADAHVAVLMVDAQEGITEQDISLAGQIVTAGRSLLITINKWDGLDSNKRNRVRNEASRRLRFVEFSPVHTISALHGSGVGKLFSSIDRAFKSAFVSVSTPQLNKILRQAVDQHPPPLVRGRRIKLRFAHLGGHNPPRVIVHGNQVQSVPGNYTRYLERVFRDALDIYGAPLRVEFRQSENPFKGRRNVLSKRQLASRRRIIQRNK